MFYFPLKRGNKDRNNYDVENVLAGYKMVTANPFNSDKKKYLA